MKNFSLLLLALGLTTTAYAQTTSPDNPDKVVSVANTQPNIVYPTFPGGTEALVTFIKQHFVIPPSAIAQRTKGRVIVQLTIKKNGRIGKIKVVKSLNKDCDKAALDVVKKMPRFNPGTKNGKPAKLMYIIPFNFQ